MSQLDAADALGMSDRTFRRWARRFDEDGDEGLVDRRLGRRSGRAVPDDAADEVERLYREMYAGFTARHFHEHLRRDHGFAWGYTWTKTWLQAGGPVAKGVLTQVGRALAQLGIEHIAAYSPQARGRSERAFRTLQDRLPKELALSGITEIAAANRHIAEVYLPAHNARFATKPAEVGPAFVPVAREQWHDILCIQEERTVALDNTVAWQGKRLQIPPHPARAHFVRAKVKVHAWPDGTLAVFHGPRRLVRWHPQNEPDHIEIAQPVPTASRAAERRGRRGHADGLPTPPTPKQQKKAVNLSAT